jgi:hypothetical protein
VILQNRIQDSGFRIQDSGFRKNVVLSPIGQSTSYRLNPESWILLLGQFHQRQGSREIGNDGIQIQRFDRLAVVVAVWYAEYRAFGGAGSNGVIQ